MFVKKRVGNEIESCLSKKQITAKCRDILNSARQLYSGGRIQSIFISLLYSTILYS